MTPADRPLPASPRCAIPECDRLLHSGLHEDSDGFRWRQDEQAAQWAFEDATEAAAKAALA